MFRTFEVTTGKNPDRSGAFNGLAFLRGLLCCRITGSLCAMVIPVSEGLIGYLEWLSLCLGKIADATDERLTALVSMLSTVRMIDGLSLPLSAYARSRPNMGQGQAGGTRPYSSRPTPQRSQE